MRPSSPIGETLVACLRPPEPPSPRLPELLASVDQDKLLTAAEHHGVEAWVHAAACAAPAPELAARLEPARLRADLVRAQTLADLAVSAAAFDAASVPWLTFKGPVLDEVIHHPPRQRTYTDLDLLVPVESLGPALDVLEQAGAVVLDSNWAMLLQQRSGELHVQLPHGSLADLHWHFFDAIKDRYRFRIPMADTMERRRRVQVGGLEVPTMDAADTLIHVALHAAHHGGGRLLWLKDIEQCVAYEAPAWDVVVTRCGQWGVGVAVATMLARTRHVLGLEASDRTLRSLGYRPPWSTLARSIDRLAPTERARGGHSPARMTAAAAGGDQWGSLAALARRAAAAVSHPFYAAPRLWDASDPRSPLYPTGGSEGRARYLAAVVREATEIGVPIE